MLISFTRAMLHFFFFNDTATTEIYTLSLHDALPIFISAADLPDNADYNVSVSTTKIIDANGNTLNHAWTFSVTDLVNCVCTPHISYLSKNHGPQGECITINGYCFDGTANKTANVSNIYFDTANAVVPPVYSGTAVGTTVPGGFSVGDTPNVSLEIDYGTGVFTSNQTPFNITAGAANGPCLWAVQPDAGQRGMPGIRFIGDRFGDTANIREATFWPSETVNVPAAEWTNTTIENVTVPMTVIDGNVFITNDVGDSNPIYFDVSFCGDGNIDPGEQCDTANLGGQDCARHGFVGGILACNYSCQFDTSSCSNAPQVTENTQDRKSTRLNSSHTDISRMPSSA